MPVLLRPFAKRNEFEFVDIEDAKKLTVYQRTLSSKLQDHQMRTAKLKIPTRQSKYFEGPHLLKCLAQILTIVGDPKEKNTFVRLASYQDIVGHLVTRAASEFHRFLRKPIEVLVDMLQFCRYLTVVPDSEEPFVVGAAAQSESDSNAQDLVDFNAGDIKDLQLIHAFDNSLSRTIEPLTRAVATDLDAEKANLACEALRNLLSALGHDADVDMEGLRALVRTPRLKLGSVVGPSMVLLRDAAGAETYTPAATGTIRPSLQKLTEFIRSETTADTSGSEKQVEGTAK